MFFCDICKFQSKQKANLIQHKRNKHDIDIIWYNCDMCDYKCKQSSALKSHKQNKHDIDVKWFECDMCDYKCKQLNSLKSHKQNKHSPNIDNINWKYKKKYKYEKSKYHFKGEKQAYQKLSLVISLDPRFQESSNLILSDDIVELIGTKIKDDNFKKEILPNNNNGILKFFNTGI